MPDGAAERASTVAQLTGYKPLPNGTRPLPSHPALLPPPQRLSEEGQQEGDAPPELEGEEEAVDEEEECSVGGEGREYALPQLVAELQPMLRCWAVQAWPPPPTSGISSLRIEQASAEVIFSGHGVGGKESPMARSVELRVRFRVAAASEGAEDEKKGRWFQGVLPFVTTDAQDQRGQGPAVRLPVTVEVCACGNDEVGIGRYMLTRFLVDTHTTHRPTMWLSVCHWRASAMIPARRRRSCSTSSTHESTQPRRRWRLR